MNNSEIVYELLRNSLLEHSLKNKNEQMFLNLTIDDWKEHVIDQSLIKKEESNRRAFKPKRGKYETINKVKFSPHEMFYLTDLKMIGVADENGSPQLIANVEKFGYRNEFPKEGDPGKLYHETYNGGLFAFNGCEYIEVNIGHIKGQLMSLKLN